MNWIKLGLLLFGSTTLSANGKVPEVREFEKSAYSRVAQLNDLYHDLLASGLNPVDPHYDFTYHFLGQECVGLQLRQDHNPGMAYSLAHIGINATTEEQLTVIKAFEASQVPAQSIYLQGLFGTQLPADDLDALIDALYHGELREELFSASPMDSTSWGGIKSRYK